MPKRQQDHEAGSGDSSDPFADDIWKREPEPGPGPAPDPAPATEPEAAAEPDGAEPSAPLEDQSIAGRLDRVTRYANQGQAPNEAAPEPGTPEQPADEPAPEPASDVMAEPAAEPTAEPEPASEVMAEPAAEPEPASEVMAEPAAEPEPASEVMAEPAPATGPAPAIEPGPAIEAALAAVAAPAAEPAPAAAQAPAAASYSAFETEGEDGSQILTVGRGIRLVAKSCECDGLVVEGHLEATALAKTLLVVKGGTFVGSAKVEVAEIHGTFEGNLIASRHLTIFSTASVSGTTRYQEIVIEAGGQISGNSQCLSDAPGRDGGLAAPN